MAMPRSPLSSAITRDTFPPPTPHPKLILFIYYPFFFCSGNASKMPFYCFPRSCPLESLDVGFSYCLQSKSKLSSSKKGGLLRSLSSGHLLEPWLCSSLDKWYKNVFVGQMWCTLTEFFLFITRENSVHNEARCQGIMASDELVPQLKASRHSSTVLPC